MIILCFLLLGNSNPDFCLVSKFFEITRNIISFNPHCFYQIFTKLINYLIDNIISNLNLVLHSFFHSFSKHLPNATNSGLQRWARQIWSVPLSLGLNWEAFKKASVWKWVRKCCGGDSGNFLEQSPWAQPWAQRSFPKELLVGQSTSAVESKYIVNSRGQMLHSFQYSFSDL